MSDGYTKLFGAIIHSSVWTESKETKILWVTLMAMADRYGVVQAAVPGLAKAADLTIAETEAALIVLTSPDKYDRSGVDEGRRIRVVPGGWLLVNHQAYRERSSIDQVREKNAERQRRWRERRGGRRNVTVTPNNDKAEAEADPEAEIQPKTAFQGPDSKRARPGGRADGKITCPPDLALVPDQRAALEVALVAPWFIEADLAELVPKWTAKTNEFKTLEQWRAQAAAAISRDWKDPAIRARLKPPLTEAEQAANRQRSQTELERAMAKERERTRSLREKLGIPESTEPVPTTVEEARTQALTAIRALSTDAHAPGRPRLRKVGGP